MVVLNITTAVFPNLMGDGSLVRDLGDEILWVCLFLIMGDENLGTSNKGELFQGRRKAVP